MFTVFVAVGLVAVASAWAFMASYVMAVQRQRDKARALVADAVAGLSKDQGVRTLEMRIATVRPLLHQSSREMLMHAAADRATPDDTFSVLAAHLTATAPGKLEMEAAAHATARDKWRRIAALRILSRQKHDAALPLLEQAISEPDTEVADAALALLGASADPRAVETLLAALRRHLHPASLVASHLEHSPVSIGPQLRELLKHEDAILRFWGATLLARYPEERCESELAVLTDDADARVRKAAIQTLAVVGDDLAVTCALKLLNDSQTFVRAHAARALGELGCSEHADRVALLLGDRDWWTRLAARESLEVMGADVWPVLMRCLGHDDAFVRNGAAEVIQNIGVLDSLIIMEAASDNPAPSKIALLQKITAAGGVRFTESLVERAGPRLGARVHALLTTMGLEHVEAA